MAFFKVTNIVDGDTFDVSPGWEWEDRYGNPYKGSRIRIADYYAHEAGTPQGNADKQKLIALLLNETVELRNGQNVSYGRLVCDVYLHGKNILG